MATTLYFRNLVSGLDAALNDMMLLERGNTATSTTTATTAGGTWLSVGFWGAQPTRPFTLAGSISMNLRGLESNNQANAGLGLRVYKWVKGTGIGSSIIQLSSTVELGTAEAAQTATATPTSTTFNGGNALVFEVGVINIGTMGSGRTVNFFFNGPTAGASGDSYVTLTENLIFARRVHLI